METGIVLDMTITLGNVLTLAGTVIAVVTAFQSARRDANRKAERINVTLAILETKVNDLWERRNFKAK